MSFGIEAELCRAKRGMEIHVLIESIARGVVAPMLSDKLHS